MSQTKAPGGELELARVASDTVRRYRPKAAAKSVRASNRSVRLVE
jgi:hypothetical protein